MVFVGNDLPQPFAEPLKRTIHLMMQDNLAIASSKYLRPDLG